MHYSYSLCDRREASSDFERGAPVIQGCDAAEGSTPNLLSGNFGKSSLHLIEPTRAGESEVDMKLRMPMTGMVLRDDRAGLYIESCPPQKFDPSLMLAGCGICGDLGRVIKVMTSREPPRRHRC